MFDIKEIKDPSFIKKLNIKELEALAFDIREFIIKNVAATGGHLASNLGVVELTIALHYVFDSPTDKFIFDVGHQSYVHKILTGRANEFHTLRKLNGISGYISKDESVHDIWESGHSSTSISAQAGLISAMEATNTKGRVISLIGDSSIANGIAFEGLNYLGQYQDKNPIIILNDNKMGINRSVGAMNRFLNGLRGSKGWRKVHGVGQKVLPNWLMTFSHKVKRGIKGFIQSDNIFEDLGFDYYGPYEGNNIKGLIKILQRVKNNNTPCIIHLITRKGQGYKPAEMTMTGFHGVDGFVPETGVINENKVDISFTEVVANELVKLREEVEFKLISPAMISSSKLTEFAKLYPNDSIDCGIAEEHAAIMSAGMALGGLKSVLIMYSTFAQRAFDQLLNDITRQNLDVLLLLDRAGVVGKDGPTHQGIYDLAMLQLMPNIKIMMGKDAAETKGLLEYGLKTKGPIALRYPKLKTVEMDKTVILDEKWEIVLEGSKGYLISYGPDVVRLCRLVKENDLDLTVINARFIRPIDNKMLDMIAGSNKPILIYEQVVESSSLAMMISYYFTKQKYNNSLIHNMAFNNNQIITHGDISEVLDYYNMGDLDILDKIKNIWKD